MDPTVPGCAGCVLVGGGETGDQNESCPTEHHEADDQIGQLNRGGFRSKIGRTVSRVHCRDFGGRVLYAGEDELLANDDARDGPEGVEGLGQVQSLGCRFDFTCRPDKEMVLERE